MKKRMIALLVTLLIVLLQYAAAETVRGDLTERFSNRPVITYQEQEYRLRSRLTTVLLAGIDKRSDFQTDAFTYRDKGQADFIMLVVLDDNRDEVSLLHINRDTMAEITVLNILGQVAGSRTAQLCLSFSFGDGAHYSASLLKDALSGLLLNVPIDHYIAMNLDGIAALNDAFGGVSVTLEDDFTAYDPEMTAGKTLKLRGKQAEYFLRYRYEIGEQTNESRLVRQRQYIDAVREAMHSRMGSKAGLAEDIVEAIAPYMISDMSKGRLINLANSIGSYTTQAITGIDGVSVVGKYDVMEFYPDEDAMMQTILQTFFEPV